MPLERPQQTRTGRETGSPNEKHRRCPDKRSSSSSHCEQGTSPSSQTKKLRLGPVYWGPRPGSGGAAAFLPAQGSPGLLQHPVLLGNSRSWACTQSQRAAGQPPCSQAWLGGLGLTHLLPSLRMEEHLRPPPPPPPAAFSFWFLICDLGTRLLSLDAHSRCLAQETDTSTRSWASVPRGPSGLHPLQRALGLVDPAG